MESYKQLLWLVDKSHFPKDYEPPSSYAMLVSSYWHQYHRSHCLPFIFGKSHYCSYFQSCLSATSLSLSLKQLHHREFILFSHSPFQSMKMMIMKILMMMVIIIPKSFSLHAHLMEMNVLNPCVAVTCRHMSCTVIWQWLCSEWVNTGRLSTTSQAPSKSCPYPRWAAMLTK